MPGLSCVITESRGQADARNVRSCFPGAQEWLEDTDSEEDSSEGESAGDEDSGAEAGGECGGWAGEGWQEARGRAAPEPSAPRQTQTSGVAWFPQS